MQWTKAKPILAGYYFVYEEGVSSQIYMIFYDSDEEPIHMIGRGVDQIIQLQELTSPWYYGPINDHWEELKAHLEEAAGRL